MSDLPPNVSVVLLTILLELPVDVTRLAEPVPGQVPTSDGFLYAAQLLYTI
jgi:hypothetical protein